MENIFSYDSKFSRFTRKAGEVLLASLFWIILSLPIITMGTATTVMYYVINKCIIDDKSYLFKELLQSFKTNFIISTKMWLFYLTLGFVFVESLYYFYHRMQEGSGWGLLYLLYIPCLILLILLFVYTFAYIARFENTFKGTLKASLFILLANFRTNLLLLFWIIVFVGLVIYQPLFLIIAPGLLFFIINRFLEKVFLPYMKGEN